MSNPVVCKLTVTGCKEDLVSFNERIISNQILKSFLPTPQELEDTEVPFPEFCSNSEQEKANFAKYGAINWLEWNLDHLGTPSSDSDSELIVESENSLVFRMVFSWSIPDKGIEKISKQFPLLTFGFSEIEDEYFVFTGDIAWRDGVMIYDHLVERERTSP